MSFKAVWGAALIMMMGSASPVWASKENPLALPRAEHVVMSPAEDGGSRSLKVLYGTYAALQVLDVTTTLAALRNGADEANPIVRAVGTDSTQLLVVKAGTAAAAIALNRVLGKKNKKAAIVAMIALNGVTAAVVAHNMRNARR